MRTKNFDIFVKIQWGEGWGGGGGGGGGCQGRCERRSEVFVKIKKKKIGRGVGVRSGGVGLGGQSGCERRILKFS